MKNIAMLKPLLIILALLLFTIVSASGVHKNNRTYNYGVNK